MKRSTRFIISIAFFAISVAMLLTCMTSCSADGLLGYVYEENTWQTEGEINNITVNTKVSDVILRPSDDGVTRVVCFESKWLKHSAFYMGTELIVSCEDTRLWYHHLIPDEKSTVTVYLPKTVYDRVVINGDTGDVEIPAGFSFGSLDVDVSTGDVECHADGVATKMNVSTSTGDVEIEGTRVGGDISVSVSTGDVELSDVECLDDVTVVGTTGGVDMSEIIAEYVKVSVSTADVGMYNVNCRGVEVECSTGSVNLDRVFAEGVIKIGTGTGSVRADAVRASRFNSVSSTGSFNSTSLTADEIYIETSTGNVDVWRIEGVDISVKTDTGSVRGSVITPKVFSPNSDTGSIKVPWGNEGGSFKINTDTGSIDIKMEK